MNEDTMALCRLLVALESLLWFLKHPQPGDALASWRSLTGMAARRVEQEIKLARGTNKI